MKVFYPDNTAIFKKLRKKYPVFTYENYQWEINNEDNSLYIAFDFNISSKYHFRPRYHIPLKQWSLAGIEESLLNNIVFHIGLVEMISYWKATCSPTIVIKPHKINLDQRKWWRDLFLHGLGEFFYVNGLEIKDNPPFSFSIDSAAKSMPRGFLLHNTDGFLIPIGGGKDSLTSLILLQHYPINKIAFAINPGKPILDSVEIAGLGNQFFEVKRFLDPLLLELNQKGFLNGHTPFSALLAFVSVLAAIITGQSNIVLSNESSANESTIPGTQINHQYSKSYEFESSFRKYLSQFVLSDIQYFSLLRPLNELQIASLFATKPALHGVFRSCNVGSKTNIWCCNCSKCLFTFIMLAPFLKPNELISIFGEDLFEKESLIPILDQLTGFAPEKPFECIGTINEVNSALGHLVDSMGAENLPKLLRYYHQKTAGIRFSSLNDQLKYWDSQHNLQPYLEEMLRTTLMEINGQKPK